MIRVRKMRLASLAALVLPLSAVAQNSAPPEPWEPDAPVPSTEYNSVFSDRPGRFSELLDSPQLPWQALYQPDGRFVPESDIASRAPASGGMSSTMPGSEPMGHDGMKHESGEGTTTMSAGAGDARGVIKKIYAKDGKLKLKHGPIDKLSMPGMTMIFNLKNPEMASDLQEGQEVGFDVEMEGTTFFITRIHR